MQVLRVLLHSNIDPEHFFSIVRKIETEETQQLDPSTVCAVKINNDKPGYSTKYLEQNQLATMESGKDVIICYNTQNTHKICYACMGMSCKNEKCPAKLECRGWQVQK